MLLKYSRLLDGKLLSKIRQENKSGLFWMQISISLSKKSDCQTDRQEERTLKFIFMHFYNMELEI